MLELIPEPWPPDFSLTREGRLVAYIWKQPGGLRLASRTSAEPVCGSEFVELLCYAPALQDELCSLLNKSSDVDAFLFKLQLHEYTLEPGARTPHAQMRRF